MIRGGHFRSPSQEGPAPYSVIGGALWRASYTKNATDAGFDPSYSFRSS
jgi:hypothetical protein